MRTWPMKSPGEVLDYAIDWTTDLAGDTITKSTWVVSPNLTNVKDSHAGTVCAIWLGGGKAIEWATNRVETSSGRALERTMRLRIGPK